LCGWDRIKLSNEYIWINPNGRHPILDLYNLAQVYEPAHCLPDLVNEVMPIVEGASSKLEIKLAVLKIERMKLKYEANEKLCARALEERNKSFECYPLVGHQRFSDDLSAIGHWYLTSMTALAVKQCEQLEGEGQVHSLYRPVLDWLKERSEVSFGMDEVVAFIRQQSVLAQRKDTFEAGALGMTTSTLGKDIRYDSNEVKGCSHSVDLQTR
jgi:hypothetical protein